MAAGRPVHEEFGSAPRAGSTHVDRTAERPSPISYFAARSTAPESARFVGGNSAVNEPDTARW
jgi:hypothetical protein